MSRNISAGIDIGSYQIKVVVAETANGKEKKIPEIIGVGYATSRGLRHGYILNQRDALKSLRTAVEQAEKSSGVKIKKALISVGGIGLAGVVSNGSVMISRADNKITELDVKKVIETSQNEIPPAHTLNRRIIHIIPIQFKADGKPVLGRPIDTEGLKLEAKVLFITCLEHHMADLVEVVEDLGIEVEDIIAAPIAASMVTISKTQKVAGCVLANIGSETVSIAVFENGIPVSLEVFPIGSNDITNDIALGLRIPIEEAEEIKKGSLVGAEYSKKKFEEIVSARLSDIFELIEAHLKKIGRNGLLPAGIVITGGGSGIETIGDMAKAALRLPSKIASINFGDNPKNQIKDSSWSVAYGLCIMGLGNEDENQSGIRVAKKAGNKILDWVKQFLP
jgi:cell division protein FtsA